MRWLGYKQVQFKTVHVDAADIRKRSKSPHVADLAQSIRDSGEELIHAPTVRMPGKLLLCGRDRMAALLMLKARKLWVRLVDCTDDEAADLEAIENIHRRSDSRADALARAVAAKEQMLTAQRGTVVPTTQRVKTEARRQVARAAGIAPASVKKAEQRSRAAAAGTLTDGEEDALAAAAEPEAPTLDLLGCDDDSARAVMKFARKDQDAIDEADKYLRLAQAALGRMTPGTVAQDLHAQVHRVASLVRSKRPESICPWCKGLPKADVPGCAPCGGAGYVPAEIAGRAPKELLNTRAVVVTAMDGKFRLYTDARDGKWKALDNGKPAKAGKSISVTKVDVSAADLEAEEAY